MSKMITKLTAAAVATATLGHVTIGSGVATFAQARPRIAPDTGLPNELKRIAIAARSERRGQIAGAQIGNTGVYVVYIKSVSVCGSGGCRARIWKREGSRFVQTGAVTVGYLPIVVLPESANGMSVLGVTVFDKNRAKLAIQPVEYDGTGYTGEADSRMLPAGSGKPLVTQAMLRAF